MRDFDDLDHALGDAFDDDDGAARTAVTLTPTQIGDLVAALDTALAARGCDNTLRGARLWAVGAHVPWPRLKGELEDNGGFCDCEVLFNVFPDPERVTDLDDDDA
ncbi:DUF2695 domain-containing protein [Pseudonocardia sp. GCM10023141]|uniref:DUF2695 domain-containing protein n=1 Tax=Pseudonocardia sp. GCM10023141 TaxID=3252653 RepID=UPI003616B1ED